MPANRQIRPALASELDHLTDVALRSKAHWGYDTAFMDACTGALTFTPELAAHTHVIEADGQVCGLYTLLIEQDHAQLENLFVVPEHIGKGYGRDLWQHAVVQARASKKPTLLIESDPNAQSFYERMGAQQVNTVLSSCIEGRTLPLIMFKL
jgi:GNAT superfamily N-acetyltransferase